MIFDIKYIDKAEAARYLGIKGAIDEVSEKILDDGEKVLLSAAKPNGVFKIFDIKHSDDGVEVLGTNLVLTGNSIKNHLEGCEKAALMAVTLSEGADRAIRTTSVSNMALSVAIDSLASAFVEQVCDEGEKQIKESMEGYYMTFRFGIGYGDLPLDLQGPFLKVLDAGKRIGVSITKDNFMIPAKSVTCIIGLSRNPIEAKKKGCQTCNLRENCQYRIKGGKCNV